MAAGGKGTGRKSRSRGVFVRLSNLVISRKDSPDLHEHLSRFRTDRQKAEAIRLLELGLERDRLANQLARTVEAEDGSEAIAEMAPPRVRAPKPVLDMASARRQRGARNAPPGAEDDPLTGFDPEADPSQGDFGENLADAF